MARRIAIFSDGTGQSIGRNDSNVLRLCRMMVKSPEQIAIYDPGIGTHVSLNKLHAGLEISEWMRLADSNPDSQMLRYLRIPRELAVGAGALLNIRQLYLALVAAYEPGDEIYLFGFSRGAFTVRAMAGLIYRCGLLHPDVAADRIDEALGWYGDHYASFDEPGRAAYRAKVDAFRRKHSRPANIRFLGIWDTVKSVGYINPVNLPHTRHNPIVRAVRHALALDERRSFYVPTTWGGLVRDKWPAVSAPASFDLDATDNPPGDPQDVEEVWFPGNHSNVGGGYSTEESAPANNSLRWMAREAAHCDLKFEQVRHPAVFASEKDEPVGRRHDEMSDTLRWRIVWSIADRVPRQVIENEPPPPRLVKTRRPAGPRDVAESLRKTANGATVSIHETALRAYPEARLPWSGVPPESLRFVATRSPG